MKLSAKTRKHLKKALFGVPSKAPGPGSYPMPDKQHAAIAKGYAKRFASKQDQEMVDDKANRILKPKPKQKVRAANKVRVK